MMRLWIQILSPSFDAYPVPIIGPSDVRVNTGLILCKFIHSSKLEARDGRYVNAIQRVASRESTTLVYILLISTPSSSFFSMESTCEMCIVR